MSDTIQFMYIERDGERIISKMLEFAPGCRFDHVLMHIASARSTWAALPTNDLELTGSDAELLSQLAAAGYRKIPAYVGSRWAVYAARNNKTQEG